MPYMALQCFSCHVMQVKEARKLTSNSKWSCVLCNEKQSMRKVYSRADTAKEIRTFVQKFNLTMGEAAQAEGMARLEAESTSEDSYFKYGYQADEDWQVEEMVGRADNACPKKSSRWDKFLPEEEQVCSEDEFEQSYDDMKFTTTIPEPLSRRRTRPRSSSPPPKRPMRGFASAVDAKPGSFASSNSRKPATYISQPDPSSKFQQGYESEAKDSTPFQKSTWKRSTVPKSNSSSSPSFDSDCSPKKGISCHGQVPAEKTSRWSKYLN